MSELLWEKGPSPWRTFSLGATSLEVEQEVDARDTYELTSVDPLPYTPYQRRTMVDRVLKSSFR